MKGVKNKDKKKNDLSEFDSEFIGLSSLLGAFLSLLGGTIDSIFAHQNKINWADIFFLFVFLSLYLWARRAKYVFVLKIVASISGIGYADYLWASYYGSYGPAVYFFIAIVGLFVFIWTGKYLYFAVSLVLLNILVLLGIDCAYPKLIDSYSSDSQRIMCVYSTLILYCVLVLILIYRGRKYIYSAYKRALEYDRLKTSFIANISHEVRTPMNAILGFSRLLEDSDLSEKERSEYIQMIISQGNNLMSQMEGLVDISKIESEDILMTQDVVNLKDLIIEIEYFCLFLKKNGVEIYISIEEQLAQRKLKFDVFHFRKILCNLLSNALKNTFSGTVEIGCRMRDQNILLFWVRDTGIGIPEEEISRIFERFYQIEREDKQFLNGGMGLGLAICRSLLDIMGGKIWVNSKEGQGSIFYFEVPFSFEPEEKLRKTGNHLTEEVYN